MRSPAGSEKGLNRKPALPAPVGGELHSASTEKLGEPAIGAAQIQNEDTRIVLERLNQEKVQGKALSRAGRAEHQRVSHVALKQIVVVGRPPLGLEDRQRGRSQVAAVGGSHRRPEDRSQRSNHARRHEHGSDLPPSRLSRHPREPGGKLPVTLPDHLGVMTGKEAPDISVQALGLS